jgi:hypothetical protein
VTLALLREEYRGHHPDGYSRFGDLYVEWRRGITTTVRPTHVAGEKLFVDFAGRRGGNNPARRSVLFRQMQKSREICRAERPFDRSTKRA